MNIKVVKNEEAKEFLRENFKTILYDVYVTDWIDEKEIEMNILYDNEKIVCAAFLMKMLRDPMKKHKNPYYLNYIYTIENERRKGYATYLANKIKENYEVSVFSTDKIATNLFKKCEYIFNDYEKLYNSFPIYRFP